MSSWIFSPWRNKQTNQLFSIKLERSSRTRTRLIKCGARWDSLNPERALEAGEPERSRWPSYFLLLLRARRGRCSRGCTGSRRASSGWCGWLGAPGPGARLGGCSARRPPAGGDTAQIKAFQTFYLNIPYFCSISSVESGSSARCWRVVWKPPLLANTQVFLS